MKILTLLFLALSLSACASSTRRMSLVVPEESAFRLSDLNHARVAKNIRGEDTGYVLLFFPLIQPSFEQAVNNTLNNGGGNILVNAEVTTDNRWFVLFGIHKIIVKGDVVNTK